MVLIYLTLNWLDSCEYNFLTHNSPNNAKSILFRETISLCNIRQFNKTQYSNGCTLNLVLSSTDNIAVNAADALTREDQHHLPLDIEIGFFTPYVLNLSTKLVSITTKLNMTQSAWNWHA